MLIYVDAIISRKVRLVVEATSRDVLRDALKSCDFTNALADCADTECEDDDAWAFDVVDDVQVPDGSEPHAVVYPDEETLEDEGEDDDG